MDPKWTRGPGHATLLEMEDYPAIPRLQWGVWAEVWQNPGQRVAHFEVCVEDRRSVAQVQSRGSAASIEAAMQRAEFFLPIARQTFQDAKADLLGQCICPKKGTQRTGAHTGCPQHGSAANRRANWEDEKMLRESERHLDDLADGAAAGPDMEE